MRAKLEATSAHMQGRSGPEKAAGLLEALALGAAPERSSPESCRAYLPAGRGPAPSISASTWLLILTTMSFWKQEYVDIIRTFTTENYATPC